MIVFTIGYEGKSPAQFTQALLDRSIDVLVDVRELPLSRKAGFSKNGLAAALGEQGVEYVHMRSLGTPPSMRRRLRRDDDYDRFFADYREHLHSNQESVDELAALAREKRVCLMCFETDPRRCHRSVLASLLAAAGFEIVHL